MLICNSNPPRGSKKWATHGSPHHPKFSLPRFTFGFFRTFWPFELTQACVTAGGSVACQQGAAVMTLGTLQDKARSLVGYFRFLIGLCSYRC